MRYIFTVFLFTIFISCSKDSTGDSEEASFSIEYLNPSDPIRGRILTVHGKGFGNNIDAVSIKFLNSSSSSFGLIQDVSDTKIEVLVPVDAIDGRFSVEILEEVVKQDIALQKIEYKPKYTLERPAITAHTTSNLVSTYFRNGYYSKKTLKSSIAAPSLTSMVYDQKLDYFYLISQVYNPKVFGYSERFGEVICTSELICENNAYPCDDYVFTVAYDKQREKRYFVGSKDLDATSEHPNYKKANQFLFRNFGRWGHIYNSIEINTSEKIEIYFNRSFTYFDAIDSFVALSFNGTTHQMVLHKVTADNFSYSAITIDASNFPQNPNEKFRYTVDNYYGKILVYDPHDIYELNYDLKSLEPVNVEGWASLLQSRNFEFTDFSWMFYEVSTNEYVFQFRGNSEVLGVNKISKKPRRAGNMENNPQKKLGWVNL